jgi:hypothetical protein
MSSRSEPKLCGISISMSRVQLGEAMSSIQPGAHKRAKGTRFGGNMGKSIKRVSRNDVREVRDHSNAVLSIGSLIRGCVDRGNGMRKSRGRVRM